MRLIDIRNSLKFEINNVMPILLGFASFVIVCGFNVLNPMNEQWLWGGGDATQHYLGWLFYQTSPWSWPPGLNPTYGIGLNNSIVFTDSIPLLAIPFKALSPLFPNTFQYFGLWALLCFVLQSWFAWKLVSLFSKDLLICSICTGLFIFSVPLLSLFPENPALASLFLILAALYLSLKNNISYPLWSWLVLLVSASLIHFYIFVLVGAIWMASILDGIFINKSTSVFQALKAILISISTVLITCYLAGYFSISSVGAYGYGVFKINLLGILNPAGWSIFTKEIYIKPHWWIEEPIYLGAGILIILVFSLGKKAGLIVLMKKACSHHIFLATVILLLAVFSVSNNVAIGSHEFYFQMSEKLIAIASILRSSGRMFIPAFYVILLIACYLITHRFSNKKAQLILGCCLILQIADLSAGWLDVRQRMTSNGPFPYSKLSLDNPFWESASKQYKNIIVIPSRFNLQADFMSRFLAKEWRIFGKLASTYGLGTNAVMLARYDEPKYLELNLKYLNELNTGTLTPENLYIIDPEQVNTAICTNLRNQSNLLAKIDGYFVLAPGFFDRNINTTNLQPLKNNADLISNFKINSSQPSSPFVLCGTWSKPENWGTWSDGSLAKIFIPITNLNAKAIAITLQAFVNGKHPEQKIEYSTDGKNFKSVSLNQFAGNQMEIPITSSMRTDGYSLLEFKLLNPVSPKSLGLGDDSRELGIGLTKLEVR
jgi:hypothetical protein